MTATFFSPSPPANSVSPLEKTKDFAYVMETVCEGLEYAHRRAPEAHGTLATSTWGPCQGRPAVVSHTAIRGCEQLPFRRPCCPHKHARHSTRHKTISCNHPRVDALTLVDPYGLVDLPEQSNLLGFPVAQVETQHHSRVPCCGHTCAYGICAQPRSGNESTTSRKGKNRNTTASWCRTLLAARSRDTMPDPRK